MDLFEQVQLELFDFLGFKKPKKVEPLTEALKLPCSLKIKRKSRQRGIRFVVNNRGVLEVVANNSTTEKEILELLSPHMDWIESQLNKVKNLHEQFPQKKWKSGELFLFNGKHFTLLMSPSQIKKPHIRFMENSFEYFYPEVWDTLSFEKINCSLKQAALEHFKLKSIEILSERVNYWTEQTQLKARSLSYRNQKTRWGSCSSQKKINLNWRLAVFRKEIQDYVIVHELCHLEHQNHGVHFWKLVEQYIPNYKELSRELSKAAFESDYLCKDSDLYNMNPVVERTS